MDIKILKRIGYIGIICKKMVLLPALLAKRIVCVLESGKASGKMAADACRKRRETDRRIYPKVQKGKAKTAPDRDKYPESQHVPAIAAPGLLYVISGCQMWADWCAL